MGRGTVSKKGAGKHPFCWGRKMQGGIIQNMQTVGRNSSRLSLISQFESSVCDRCEKPADVILCLSERSEDNAMCLSVCFYAPPTTYKCPIYSGNLKS